MQCVADCDTDNPKTFEQPVIQTLQMFVGESGCWLVVFISWLLKRYSKGSKDAANGPAYQPVDTTDSDEEDATPDEDDDEAVADLSTSQTLVDPTNVVAKPVPEDEALARERVPLEGWRVTILALPAICDICGTTLMNAGLLFVAASIYQMTRGALVLFVGLFSVMFLKRHLGGWKWASLFIVVIGVAIVGLAGYLDRKGETSPDVPGDTQPGKDALIHHALLVARGAVSAMQEHTAAETVLGVLMIAGAQVFTASQFVLEESIMAKYSIDPIRCVGFEGIFGFMVTLIGMGVLHGAIGTGYFNAREAFYQVFHNRAIGFSSVLIMISIG
jgi:drug/metabolite transporter (DMT)-like permease